MYYNYVVYILLGILVGVTKSKNFCQTVWLTDDWLWRICKIVRFSYKMLTQRHVHSNKVYTKYNYIQEMLSFNEILRNIAKWTTSFIT